MKIGIKLIDFKSTTKIGPSVEFLTERLVDEEKSYILNSFIIENWKTLIESAISVQGNESDPYDIT